MFYRNALLLVAGAAFFALDASSASAQTKKTTSSKRIPITKESPGEVAPRVDTVTVYKTDTLRMMGRVDTLRLTGPTVTVHDTVMQSVPMVARHIGGMYLGLGAGPALPYGSIRTVNEPGTMGQVNLGWQGVNSALGFRLDGAFTQYADNADYDLLGPKPEVWNGNADVRLNLPFFNHTLGSSVLFTPYLIGGGSWLHYRNLRAKLDADNGTLGTNAGYGPQHAVIAGSTTTTTTGTGAGLNLSGIQNSNWESSWGYNFGGGLAFHAGKKEMFVEARWIHFTPENNTSVGSPFSSAWHVPVTFGVNFF
ncbi:MAG TPA: hypothetical protein VN706_24075 [Gemmatimonadaceae bacterium]|nr:hypothetical protein [Gemmatimonadaceae bacterium]